MKNILDSSGWIEYFLEEENIDFFLPVIEDSKNLFVSPINIYEVSKVLLQKFSEEDVLEAMLFMKQFEVTPLSPEISFLAAQIASTQKLAMADSLILASSQSIGATLWTQDIDFKEIEGVQYIQKK